MYTNQKTFVCPNPCENCPAVAGMKELEVVAMGEGSFGGGIPLDSLTVMMVQARQMIALRDPSQPSLQPVPLGTAGIEDPFTAYERKTSVLMRHANEAVNACKGPETTTVEHRRLFRRPKIETTKTCGAGLLKYSEIGRYQSEFYDKVGQIGRISYSSVINNKNLKVVIPRVRRNPNR